MFNQLLGLFSNDIGIDLGTANTLVYVKDKGIVLREPSVVAVHTGSRKVLAVGDEAKKMLGRTPGNITAIRPMKDGVIADFDITEAMLRYFIKKVHNNSKIVSPRVVVAIPSGITEVEKRAVKESATHAGAREVITILEPMAAALGVGLPVDEPAANMIVDIGGGTTEIAIISLSGIVFSKSIRVAPRVVIAIPSGITEVEKRAVKESAQHAGARDVLTIVEPMAAAIVEAVRAALERCPPELSADLVDRGFVMAGGGSLIRGIDKLLSEKTGLPVTVSDDPLSAVANGTGVFLNNIDELYRVAADF